VGDVDVRDAAILLRLTLTRSQREAGLLEKRLDVPEELRAGRAVDCAVVAGERQLHPRPRDDLTVHDDGLLLRRTDREDRGLRRGGHPREAPRSPQAAGRAPGGAPVPT